MRGDLEASTDLAQMERWLAAVALWHGVRVSAGTLAWAFLSLQVA